jgi:hypothetical protein
VAAPGQQPVVKPPLQTKGHQILDAAGHGVRLTSVNWYGFDQKEFVVEGSITHRWTRLSARLLRLA